MPVAWPGRARRRLRGLRMASGPPVADGRRSRLLTAAGIGLAVAGFVGTWWGVAAGAVAAVVAERLLRRREPPHLREERLAATADLPLGADLLAAALRAGAPLDRAAGAV